MDNTLSTGTFTQHRKVTGAPVVADSTDLSLIDRRALLHCRSYRTILAQAQLTGGAAPTVTLQPLLYDPEKDDFTLLPTLTLSDGQSEEITVHETRAYLRIHAVAGAPTTVELRAAPGVAGTLS